MRAAAPEKRLEWAPRALEAYLSTLRRIAEEDPFTARHFMEPGRALSVDDRLSTGYWNAGNPPRRTSLSHPEYWTCRQLPRDAKRRSNSVVVSRAPAYGN